MREVPEKHAVFLAFLQKDSLRNIFALYDLQEEADLIRCYAATIDDSFVGYLLAWHGRRYPNVIITGTEEAAEMLLPRAPPHPCTFMTTPELAATVEAEREITARRLMDFMHVDERSFRPSDPRDVQRLGAKDATALDALYGETIEEPRPWGEWAERGIAYGVRRGERLVAAAGTHFVSQGRSLIGGVYTSPRFRRRGCATAVTSAVTAETLRRSNLVGLMVVSSNVAAIRLYEKLGYQRGPRWAWLDRGTGHVPLA